MTVIECHPLAPILGIGVDIIDRGSNNPKGACGIGVLFAGLDIARVVIGPNSGLARLLVVLPGQLVGGVKHRRKDIKPDFLRASSY